MSEFSAFLAGLILGDTSPESGKPKRTDAIPKKNVALQDVIFCQALKNTLDRLQDFVDQKRPSPKEFIVYLLPRYQYDEPYTTEEQIQVDERAQKIKDYVKWIEDRTKPKATGDRVSWEDFTVLQMIWDDPAHTPDPDNLDLLFGDPLVSKPVKLNGRVYEYGTFYAPYSGLAKGFFSTIAAQVISLLCSHVTMQMLDEYGFTLDHSRDEFCDAAKSGHPEAWKKMVREEAYKLLRKDHKDFCAAPWSEMTRQFKKEEDEKLLRERLSAQESGDFEREISRVIKKMTRKERLEYSSIDFDLALKLILVFSALLVICTVVFLIVTIDLDQVIGGAMLTTFGVFLFVTIIHFICLFKLPSVFIILYLPLLWPSVRQSLRKRVKSMQTAYYFSPGTPDAEKYAEFLSRL